MNDLGKTNKQELVFNMKNKPKMEEENGMCEQQS